MRLKVSNVCQLLDKNEFRETHVNNGITYTNNGNGTFTLNGTTTSASGSSIYSSDSGANMVKANHKYLMLGFPIALDGNNYVYFQYYPFNTSIKYYILNNANGYLFFTPTDDGDRWNIFLLFKTTGFTVNNITIKPQLFDLTEMYGAGNEPTTVEQFRQDFPNEMYEYSPVCWKKFSRLKYIANKEPVQLLDKSKYYGSSTIEGVTFTNNGDGTWTVVGTAPDVPANKECVRAFVIIWNLEFSKKHFIPGHKIIVAGGVSIDSAGKVADVQWVWGWTGGYDAANSWERTVHTIRQYPEDKLLEYSNYIELRVYAGATVNFTFKPQFFDLTEMYGAGNEPTTVEQFRADFPNELYDYNLYNYLTLNRGKYIANKEPVQLLDKSKFYKTSVDYGVTWTNNGDGTITANGTATNIATYTLLVPNPRVIPGHKYLFISSITPQQADVATIITNIGGESGNGFIFTTDLTHINIYFYVRTNVTVSNVVFKPQLFDLTAMYGAGNEPATVAQFRADFPNELYDYNPYNAITFR